MMYYVNPFKDPLEKLFEESDSSERFAFRYEDDLRNACKSNPHFREIYFHFLLKGNFTSSQLLFFTYLRNHSNYTKHDNSNIKYKIKNILDDHWDNYERFMSKLCKIPNYVYENVEKVRQCRTKALGYHYYTCPNCGNFSYEFHTCKSRFCSSCGVKYAKNRSIQIQKKVFNCNHRHIVFTIPNELRIYFKKDKSLLDLLFKASNNVIEYCFNKCRELKRKDKSKQYKITPGFISVLHTFGRDLKWNPHIHMLISEGGHDSRTNKFINIKHFNYNLLRKSWQKSILDLMLQNIGPKFYKIKNMLYNKKDNGFYVYAPIQQFKDTKKGIDYVVRYTGRPVMSEARITNYDGKKVTWFYHPHEDEDKTITVIDDAFDFISKLIQHIPSKQFKTIRYFGAYAAKNHKYRLCKDKLYKDWEIKKSSKLNEHRFSIIFNFEYDPIECKKCHHTMELEYGYYIKRKDGEIIYEKQKYYKQNKWQKSTWQDRTQYCPRYY